MTIAKPVERRSVHLHQLSFVTPSGTAAVLSGFPPVARGSNPGGLEDAGQGGHRELETMLLFENIGGMGEVVAGQVFAVQREDVVDKDGIESVVGTPSSVLVQHGGGSIQCGFLLEPLDLANAQVEAPCGGGIGHVGVEESIHDLNAQELIVIHCVHHPSIINSGNVQGGGDIFADDLWG